MNVRVLPWRDELVERLGFAPGDPYVERYWLPVIGPTAFVMLRRLVDGLTDQPEGYDLDVSLMAECLGLGAGVGEHSSVVRTLRRLGSGRFEFVKVNLAPRGDRPDPVPSLYVRLAVPPLARRQILRLPPALAAELGSTARQVSA